MKLRYLKSFLRDLEKLKDKKTKQQIKVQIEQIKNYTNYKVSGLLDHNADTSPITSYFNYDFILWMKNKSKVSELNLYSFGEPTKFTFKYDDHQLKIRNDNFSRYGVDANALSKVVTRISNLESLFRKVEIENHVFECENYIFLVKIMFLNMKIMFLKLKNMFLNMK